MAAAHLFQSSLALSDLERFYRKVRHTSEWLGEPLSDADATLQSMTDASPAKWHLPHTTWFFVAMVLSSYLQGYRPFDERFTFLFSSYYATLGARRPRPRRGMITRPALEEVYVYRAHVNQAVGSLLGLRPTREVTELIELDCHHERRHQELLLTDILHLLAQNPIRPAYRDPARVSVETAVLPALSFTDFEVGLGEIGHDGVGLAFDSEGPRHRVLTEPFRLANRLVTNAEWMEFIEDGRDTKPLLWLSEGWAKALAEGWSRPLYWETSDGQHWTTTLRGFRLVDPTAPVVHVSYFETDAFATWSGKRLPKESAKTRRGRQLSRPQSRQAQTRVPTERPGCGRCTATSGSVRAVRSRFTRASARSASTMASHVWAVRLAKWLLRDRRDTSARATAISSRRTRVGNSRGSAWRRTPSSSAIGETKGETK
jgi:ergothioneine biosynthesis protein EgtB